MRKLRIGMAAAGAAVMLAATPLTAHAAGGWQTQTTPTTDTENILSDADALSPNDVWAAGPAYDDGHSMLIHWDGTRWSRETGPAQDQFTARAVSGVYGDSVWAAGSCTYDTEPGEKACVAHWNGSEWSAPVRLPGDGAVNAIHAIALDDVWAAGTKDGGLYYAHYDGAGWTQVAAPGPGGGQAEISDLAAGGPGDVWAAGYRSTASGAQRPLVQHWNGTSWTTFATPDTEGALRSITPLTGTRVWAVGWGAKDAMVLRRSGNGFLAAPEVPGSDLAATGVAPDGSDSAWIALQATSDPGAENAASGTAHYAHFADGKWTLSAGGTYPGSIAGGALVQVPGTSSLYAVGAYVHNANHGYVEKYDG